MYQLYCCFPVLTGKYSSKKDLCEKSWHQPPYLHTTVRSARWQQFLVSLWYQLFAGTEFDFFVKQQTLEKRSLSGIIDVRLCLIEVDEIDFLEWKSWNMN